MDRVRLTFLLAALTYNNALAQDDSFLRNGDPCPAERSLPCKNGSKCVMGMADFGFHKQFDLPFLNSTHMNFMHCECPEGFTGIMCEHKVETCGNDEHACFNGAKCVRLPSGGDDQKTYKCDCTMISNTTSFAGHMCEHAATSFCEYGVAVSKHSFCVNGGKCVETVAPDEAHMGCICPEGYTGDHCEKKYTDAAQQQQGPTMGGRSSESSPANKQGVVAFFFLLVVIIGGAITAILIIATKIRKERRAAAAQQRPVENAAVQNELGLDPDGGTMPDTKESKEVPDQDGEFI